MKRIYLDNNATTRLDERVLKAMLPELQGPPANPSSVHFFGRAAREKLEHARSQTAEFFHAKPHNVFFTSGGTESLNLLLGNLTGPILTTNIEHSAIYETLLKKNATMLASTPYGAPTVDEIRAALQPDTKAIVLTLSNSETGVKIDLPAIADLALNHNIPLYLDAVSYVGKEPLPIHPAIYGYAIAAHKFHGPKGIGALITKTKLSPLLTGGGQEMGKRSGTENLAGILGLAEALSIVQENQTQITEHILGLRSHFEMGLFSKLEDISMNGTGPRICNTVNIAFHGVDGESLLIKLDQAGIAASHGSACSSGALEPSRVLLNMGLPRKTARSSIRFSFSRDNTIEEVDEALERIVPIVRSLR